MEYAFNKERKFSEHLFSSENRIIREWNYYPDLINLHQFYDTAYLRDRIKRFIKARDTFYGKHQYDLLKWQKAEVQIRDLEPLYKCAATKSDVKQFPYIAGFFGFILIGSVTFVTLLVYHGAPVLPVVLLILCAGLCVSELLDGIYSVRKRQELEEKIYEYSNGQRQDISYYFELKKELFNSEAGPHVNKEENRADEDQGQTVEKTHRLRTEKSTSVYSVSSSNLTLFGKAPLGIDMEPIKTLEVNERYSMCL